MSSRFLCLHVISNTQTYQQYLDKGIAYSLITCFGLNLELEFKICKNLNNETIQSNKKNPLVKIITSKYNLDFRSLHDQCLKVDEDENYCSNFQSVTSNKHRKLFFHPPAASLILPFDNSCLNAHRLNSNRASWRFNGQSIRGSQRIASIASLARTCGNLQLIVVKHAISMV